MHHPHLSFVAILLKILLWTASVVGLLQPAESPAVRDGEELRSISTQLFVQLEELSRIVDIAYCVGTTGIQKPFLCASRCQDFDHFELITTWSTGLLLSDSCGYLAVDRSPRTPRIIMAFRGSYSIANMIIDLSIMPQKYVPYRPDDDERPDDDDNSRCENCTVHAGFLFSWMQTRKIIIPLVKKLKEEYPDHQLTLVGHSLGGAIAALAALEFHRRGWDPQVTTFGEPRVGNEALMAYIDTRFNDTVPEVGGTMFRRVTHVGDQVPLLPLQEWGYRMHGGEIFISKAALPPSIADLHHCDGDEDPRCIAGDRIFGSEDGKMMTMMGWAENEARSKKLGRYEAQFIMSHRDYFWRLGLCIPGGDPTGGWPSPGQRLDWKPEEL